MGKAKATRSKQKAHREEWFRWVEQMIRCHREMLSPEEREDLDRWERENLDGGIVGTSDWPGWRKHIGKSPKGLTVVSTPYVM